MPSRQREPGVSIALLLAWVAGGVDAIGYLSLGQLFTAHMSGNTAALGAYLGRGEWSAALHRALPIPAFLLGVALGTAWIEEAARRKFRSPCAGALWGEGILLLTMVGVSFLAPAGQRTRPTWPLAVQVALAAGAMGLQNAALRRVNGTRIRTTFISGMLTDFSEEGVTLLRTCLRGPARDRSQALRRTLLYGGIWLAFLAGAGGGAAAQLRYATLALLLPVAGLAVLLAWDLRYPIPVDDGLLAQAPSLEGSR